VAYKLEIIKLSTWTSIANAHCNRPTISQHLSITIQKKKRENSMVFADVDAGLNQCSNWR
jgi:hypothetical protein